MNTKTDGWESYTDDTGRRHWRWPAESRPGVNPQAEAGPRQYIGTPRPQPAHYYAPMRLKGK
jgi:hypothetical protein